MQADESPTKDIPIRERIIEKAMELVRARVPFRPYGRFPYEPKRIRGLDCAGVIIWVGQQLGLYGDVTLKPYAFPPQIEAFLQLADYCDAITEPSEGSIVIIGRREGSPIHCGIMHKVSDGSWAVIGVSPVMRRPYVTVYPIADVGDLPLIFFDYRGIA